MFKENYELTCKNEVAFVTFNYDLSLEKYFFDVLGSYFKITEPKLFFENDLSPEN
jgi:hypothetical protein